jgi:osmotically inducible lipoprotein OsmB
MASVGQATNVRHPSSFQHRIGTRSLLMSRISYLALCAALVLATAACGDTPGERALTGGVSGAGGGALVGAAAGNLLAGAIVGGLSGAAIGAATTPREYYR